VAELAEKAPTRQRSGPLVFLIGSRTLIAPYFTTNDTLRFYLDSSDS
jgi:hypothetical protein